MTMPRMSRYPSRATSIASSGERLFEIVADIGCAGLSYGSESPWMLGARRCPPTALSAGFSAQGRVPYCPGSGDSSRQAGDTGERPDSVGDVEARECGWQGRQ